MKVFDLKKELVDNQNHEHAVGMNKKKLLLGISYIMDRIFPKNKNVSKSQ